jgi:hypothetical protein
MTLVTLAVALLLLSACLFAITAVCEREALRQMEASDFHHVPQIRFGRNLRIPAVLCVVAYMLVCMTASPLTGSLTALLAFIFTMSTQARAMVYGEATQVFLRGLVPSLLGLTTLANLSLQPTPNPLSGLELPLASVGLALLAGALSWLTAWLRVEQDLMALRD